MVEAAEFLEEPMRHGVSGVPAQRDPSTRLRGRCCPRGTIPVGDPEGGRGTAAAVWSRPD